MKQVMLVQPYVPAYRWPFFKSLEHELAQRDIALILAHGTPWGKDAQRTDSREYPGAIELPQRTWEFAGRHLVYREMGGLAKQCDALILSQALHTLDSYLPLLRGSGPRVGLWGHGKTYSRKHSALMQRVKRAFTNRAQWFFSYTEKGARHVISHGFPEDRVTVVRNSIDTTRVTKDKTAVSGSQVAEIRREMKLEAGRTALFIGSLDEAKRIPYLLSAAESVARDLPGFRLVIAGDGPQRGLVEQAAKSCQTVEYVGRVENQKKALLAEIADVLIMPGGVGLVAVDSLAHGLPVVTTENASHGPEFEYLKDGRNAVVVEAGDPDHYANAVTRLLSAPERVALLRNACSEDARAHSTEQMARLFADGVEGLLMPPKRVL